MRPAFPVRQESRTFRLVIETRDYGIEIQDLHKTYGDPQNRTQVVEALRGVSLLVNPGELFVILGPSGCGKSTLLRSLAGLEEPERGSIVLGRRTVFDAHSGVAVPAQERGIGMVFQEYALYPHMTVERNVAFGLRTRKVPAPQISERTRAALEMVEMDELADRRPASLSGGQQQRVALARAVATNPKILLFDEPLSNLDPMLRTMLRGELRQLIRRVGTTTVFVTHDQEEAMIMADRVAVMNNGRVEQIGTPQEIYRLPQTVFVARFTGRPMTNLVEGMVEHHQGRWILVPTESRAQTLCLSPQFSEFRGQRVILHIRPEDITVSPEPDETATTLNVKSVMPEGGHTFMQCELGGPYEPLLIRAAGNLLARELVGTRIHVRLGRTTVYSPDSSYLLKEIPLPNGATAGA